MKDYYYILGLKKGASIEDIKKAYRKLSLKFHPDKNDGDEFFTDRFKEIQEAYETLADNQRRSIYDNAFSNKMNYESTNRGYNFDPIIEYFETNKTQFEFDEEITFRWKTINSDKVTIRPFGVLQPIGQKTYRIKDFKNPFLNFELIAENTNTKRQVKSKISLKNRTFQEQYSFFKKIIESENSINRENKQDTKNNNSNLNTETVYRITTENIKLKIVSQNNKTIGAKVFINDSPAHDGIYVYKALTHKLIIRNGEIIERFYLEKVNDFIFEKKYDSEPTIGDKVYLLNGGKIKDGKLKYSFFKSFNIKNEQII